MIVMLVGGVLLGHFILSGFIYPDELLTGAAMLFVGISVTAVLGIYNIYDAYNTAKKSPSP